MKKGLVKCIDDVKKLRLDMFIPHKQHYEEKTESYDKDLKKLFKRTQY